LLTVGSSGVRYDVNSVSKTGQLEAILDEHHERSRERIERSDDMHMVLVVGSTRVCTHTNVHSTHALKHTTKPNTNKLHTRHTQTHTHAYHMRHTHTHTATTTTTRTTACICVYVRLLSSVLHSSKAEMDSLQVM
jgi:hypothetical protein